MLCVASRTAAQHGPPATTSKGKTMHPGTIHRLVWGALWISALAGGMAHAQLTAIVAVEPTEKKAGNSILRSALEAGLSKASGQTVTVTTTEDLADAMRATRSGGYDIFIGPPQVAASALQRGYELVGCSQKSDHYVLVGLPQIESVGALKGKRLYLPQQDSVYSYMGRGMLNEAGLSFKDLKSVRHEKYPQAGLSALTLGTTDATVVRAEECPVVGHLPRRGQGAGHLAPGARRLQRRGTQGTAQRGARQAFAVAQHRIQRYGPGSHRPAARNAGISKSGRTRAVHPHQPAGREAGERQGCGGTAGPGRRGGGHPH